MTLHPTTEQDSSRENHHGKANSKNKSNKAGNEQSANLHINKSNIKKGATTMSTVPQQQSVQPQCPTVHKNDRFSSTSYPSAANGGHREQEFQMNRAMSSYGYVRSPYGWFYDPTTTYHPPAQQSTTTNTNGCAPSSYFMPGYDHSSYRSHHLSGPTSTVHPTRLSPHRSNAGHQKTSSHDISSMKSSSSSSAFVPHISRPGVNSSIGCASQEESSRGGSFHNESYPSHHPSGRMDHRFPSSHHATSFYPSSSGGRNANQETAPRTSPSSSSTTVGAKDAAATTRTAQENNTPFEPHRVLMDITNRSWEKSRKGETSTKQSSSKSIKDNVQMETLTFTTATAGRVSVSLNSGGDTVHAKRTVDDMQSVSSSVSAHSTSPSLPSSSSSLEDGPSVAVVESTRQSIKRQRSASSMSGASHSSSILHLVSDSAVSNENSRESSFSSSTTTTTTVPVAANQNSRGMLDLLCEATDIVIKNMMEQKETSRSSGNRMMMAPTFIPPRKISDRMNYTDKSFHEYPNENLAQHVMMSRLPFIKPIQPAPITNTHNTTPIIAANNLSPNKNSAPTLRISPHTTTADTTTTNSTSTGGDGKLPKPCSCPRSQCIKLYCDCFQSGRFCSSECSCKSCKNKASENGPTGLRTRAIQNILARNPFAFRKDKDILEKLNNRAPGINCRCVRSQCLKLYCDCFQAGQICGDNCLCVKCMNTVEESGDYGKRNVARAVCLSRNPDAFKTKVKKTGEGCSCKNSRCLKKYCDCFNNSVICSSKCICRDCENRDPNAFRIKNDAANTVLTIST